MNESCHTHICDAGILLVAYESFRIHESVVLHIWMSHVAHMTQSCRVYDYVMSHTHISSRNICKTKSLLEIESCRIYAQVMSRIQMCHVAHTHTSNRNTASGSPITSCRVVHSNESCHTHMEQEYYQDKVSPRNSVMSHICTSHVAHTNMSCRKHTHIKQECC